jgi:DNA-binding GntR family transcriptional regulator
MTDVPYQPHYRQIEQALRERVAAMQPGERVPSDTELCAEFGVSRMTARNAMQRLAEDGLVSRQPGRGSFVAAAPPHRRANRLMTFTREMARLGRVPSSRVLTRVIRSSGEAEATRLGIPRGQPIVELRRLRLADDEPIAIETAILIGECADAVMTADLAHGSLHEILAAAGFVLRRGAGTIDAAAATAEDARLLALRAGDPLLVERRVIEDGQGRRIEATESRYAAARYGLAVQFDVEGPDRGPVETAPRAPGADR